MLLHTAVPSGLTQPPLLSPLPPGQEPMFPYSLRDLFGNLSLLFLLCFQSLPEHPLHFFNLIHTPDILLIIFVTAIFVARS